MNSIIDIIEFRKVWETHRVAGKSSERILSIDEKVSKLEGDVELLTFMTKVYSELILEKLGITETCIQTKIEEVHAREEDTLVKCEKCNREYNSRRTHCLYCGYVNVEHKTIA